MIQKTEIALQRLLLLAVVCAMLWSVLTALYFLSGRHDNLSRDGFFSLALTAVTATLIGYGLVQNEGGIRIDLTRPLSLYGMFYFLYYVLPYLVLFYLGLIPHHNEQVIAGLVLLGYLGFFIGMTLSGVKKPNQLPASSITKHDANTLLALSAGAICVIAYVYAWRDTQGIFYNQARFYEQEATVEGGLRDVFGLSLQLPVLLCLGLLSAVPYRTIARCARWLLVGYGIGIFLLMVLSSQTRLAITVLIFLVVAIRLYRPTPSVKLWHAMTLCAVGIAAMLIIQGVRVSLRDQYVESQNQFRYALRNTLSLGYAGVRESSDVISQTMTQRSGAGIDFLSEIIDGIQGDFLYGKGVVTVLPSAVPRIIWADKPVLASPQLEYEHLLGLAATDAPLTALNQFYAEGGIIGVLVGYVVFGWLLGKLTNFVFGRRQVLVFLPLFFLWSAIVQVENETVVGTIIVLRNALVVNLIYIAVSLALRIVPSSERHLQIGRETYFAKQRMH